jgi:hypothetical protein
MRSNTPAPVADPWAVEIDDGWRDLIVSSAPPPPREAMTRAATPREIAAIPELRTREIRLRNQKLPSDLNTWQEHGSARPKSGANEPGFSAGDRRMWLIAGGLMGLAALVLGLLGMLTFGAGRTVEPTATSETAGASEPAHEPSVPSRREPTAPLRRGAAVEPAVATTVGRDAPATHVGKKKHAHHHKPIASR